MSVAVTYAPGSTTECGAGAFTGLPTATALQVFPGVGSGGVLAQVPPMTCRERHDMRLFVHVAADHAFDLNYLFTPDGGTTWYVGEQVVGATVPVDGGVAGFVKSAVLETHVGYQWKVEIYNNSGSDAAGAFEYRYAT
jgi:hypothetical protein